MNLISRMWMFRNRVPLIVLLLAAPSLLWAQAGADRAGSANNPAAPSVTFTFDWPSLDPHHYTITVDSNGRARYESLSKDNGQPADPYTVQFTVSPQGRDRIFTLTRQLDYFNGDFEFRKHKVASTGQKTLTYADAEKHYETRYNWSENPGVQQLTSYFQGISVTLEAGPQLQRLYRFERLGLNDELRNLEHAAEQHSATELQLIAPILEKIADDHGVMNIARERARRLLQMAGTVQ